jgi:hypothetical protein
MQVHTDGNMGTKRTVRQDDEKSKVGTSLSHTICYSNIWAELLQFTNGDMGATQLENGEVGFTQIDTGCTQLNQEANLEEA